MKPVFDSWVFSSSVHREAAQALFEWSGHISHAVGMAVHDGSHHRERALEPGMVFSVDPTVESKGHALYVRVEDTVVVTETGMENLTEGAPIELDDVETLMKEDGLLQAFPADG
jgi:Xaa-Pro aminopeptidase